jgi:DNA-binding CsgD family transcriptional regulator
VSGATSDAPETAPGAVDISVSVLSCSPFITDAASLALAARGCIVPVDPTTADVVLLVEPDDSAWERQRALGLPTVVLADGPPIGQALVDAVSAGVHGWLSPTGDVAALVEVLQRVADGDSALTARQLRAVVDAIGRTAAPSTPVELSSRERDILQSIDRGESVKQTARRLGISPRTVDNTQRVLFRKLSARNRAQAIARAHALGLVTREAS